MVNLKSLYNDSKIPLIPPLLVNNKIVADFTEKANLFNDFFATQHMLLPNNSILPSVISGGTPPPNFRGGDLKISDQNNWRGPEQKIKFGDL